MAVCLGFVTEKFSLSVRLGDVCIRLAFRGVEAIYLRKRAAKKLRESLRKVLVYFT